MRVLLFICGIGWLLGQSGFARAQDSLPQRIDALILAKVKGQPISPLADDAEYLRRIYLDFAGRIPSVSEARKFLDDKQPDKRTKLLDELLTSPSYAVRMEELFHLMLMEQLGDHPEWRKYLQGCFTENKPWDQMAREILDGMAQIKTPTGAAFFLSKRLENYGQNPVDYPALTRDIGRLFLGKDFAVPSVTTISPSRSTSSVISRGYSCS
jgi:hypothetical protein